MSLIGALDWPKNSWERRVEHAKLSISYTSQNHNRVTWILGWLSLFPFLEPCGDTFQGSHLELIFWNHLIQGSCGQSGEGKCMKVTLCGAGSLTGNHIFNPKE